MPSSLSLWCVAPAIASILCMPAPCLAAADSLRGKIFTRQLQQGFFPNHLGRGSPIQSTNSSRPQFPIGVTEVLGQPAKVFGDLTNQVGNFESSLLDLQREKLSSIAAQKMEYERKLDAQRRSIAKMANANLRINSSISAMKRHTARLRTRIQELESENGDLRNDFDALISNLSVVKEVAVNALRKGRIPKDLDVLTVFRREEKTRHAVEAKNRFWRRLRVDDMEDSDDDEDDPEAEPRDMEGRGGAEDDETKQVEDEEGEDDDRAAWADASNNDWAPDEGEPEDEEGDFDHGFEDDFDVRRPGGAASSTTRPLRWARSVAKQDDFVEVDEDFHAEPQYPTLFLQLETQRSTESVGQFELPDMVGLKSDHDSVELPNPMLMLKDLHDNLDNLNQVHDLSARKLKTIFADQFEKGAERYKELQQGQNRLNETFDELAALKPRLVAAESHLLSVRRYLVRQLQALRAFVTTVGTAGIPELMEEGAQRDQRNGVSNGNKGTILLQVQGGTGTTTTEPLARSRHMPMLSDVLTSSYDSFRKVDTNVGQLEEHLLNMEEKAKGVLLDTQLGYEDTLMSQNRESLRLAKINTNIASDIHSTKKLNQKLQHQARQTQKEIMLIRHDLGRVNANITIALEFAKNTLSHCKDRNAPELQVVRELDRKDEELAVREAERQRFNEIADPWKGVLQDASISLPPILLEVGQVHNRSNREETPAMPLAASFLALSASKLGKGFRTRGKDSRRHTELLAQERGPGNLESHNRPTQKKVTTRGPTLRPWKALLSEMEANLRKLGSAHDASKETLKQIFDDAYKQGQHRRSALTNEQKLLNESFRFSAALTPKLRNALRRVDAVHKALYTQDTSVKKFLVSLGRSGEAQTAVEAEDMTGSITPSGFATTTGSFPSLLQMTSRTVLRRHSKSATARKTASEQKHEPEGGGREGQDAENRADSFAAMSSKATALQQKLTEIEAQNQQKLAGNAAEYSRRLVLVDSKTRALRARAEDLEAQIVDIDMRSTGLRKRAAELQLDRARLTADVEAVGKNLTTAAEFATHTLRDLGASDAPELQVLTDLNAQEQLERATSDRLNRLGEIASASAGPLALVQTTAGDTPKALLAVLEGGLADLSKEHEVKVQEAHARFEERMKKKYDEYRVEEERVKALNAKKDKALALNARLERAVKHLEEKCTFLQSRAKSLRSFAARVSRRPEPKTAFSSSVMAEEKDKDEAQAPAESEGGKAAAQGDEQAFAHLQKHVAEAVSDKLLVKPFLSRLLR